MENHRTSRGFTTFELIAVLAAILLLLVLTWPSLQARRKVALGEELRQAMDKGDRDDALRLLELGAPPDAWSGATPHYCLYCKAINTGDRELFRLIAIPEQNNVRLFVEHCPPLLILALERHDAILVQELLALGAPVTERNRCQVEGPDFRYIRSSPLGFALEMNNNAMIELLLAHASPEDLQVPIRTSGPGGKDPTLIHSAVRSGNPDWVKLLVGRGIPVNGRNLRGETALHEAARICSREMVEILLSCGADPSIKDDSGARSLDEAPVRFYAEMAELLEEPAGVSAGD